MGRVYPTNLGWGLGQAACQPPQDKAKPTPEGESAPPGTARTPATQASDVPGRTRHVPTGGQRNQNARGRSTEPNLPGETNGTKRPRAVNETDSPVGGQRKRLSPGRPTTPKRPRELDSPRVAAPVGFPCAKIGWPGYQQRCGLACNPGQGKAIRRRCWREFPLGNSGTNPRGPWARSALRPEPP